jgi:hypothetical protein
VSSRAKNFTNKSQLSTGTEIGAPPSIEVLIQARLLPRWIAFVVAGFAVESAAAAPRLRCYQVMPGDTVTSIAIRVTRDSQGWRGSAFQILDPAAARFVPKERYDHIRPEWQACIIEPVLERTAVPNQRAAWIGWWVLIMVGSLTAAGLFAIQASVAQRKAVSEAMETFGRAFIREFERPLADERSSQSVLRAELALSPNRRSLEVLLAPADGRTYPNLADHRTNLEYDVERVVSVLNDRRFICGAVRTRGPWVAVPFRLEPDFRKEG